MTSIVSEVIDAPIWQQSLGVAISPGRWPDLQRSFIHLSGRDAELVLDMTVLAPDANERGFHCVKITRHGRRERGISRAPDLIPPGWPAQTAPNVAIVVFHLLVSSPSALFVLKPLNCSWAFLITSSAEIPHGQINPVNLPAFHR